MRYLAFIALFISASSLKAQVNLVPNPSFEEVIGCPFSGGQIDGVTSWTNVFGSVDYYHECGSNGYGIPLSWGGWQYARTGQAYLGVAVWSLWVSNGHEFVGVYLTDSLIPSKKYKVEFYVNMSDSNWYAVRNIGAYFSQTQPSANITFLLNLEPQISYTDSAFLLDKKNWTKIEGSFIAQGGEKFITIGNFDDDTQTYTLFVDSGAVYRPTTPNYWTNSYYFIDDVSVILDTTYVGIGETQDIDFSVYPNPATTEITVSGYSPVYLKLCNAVGQTVTESKSNKLYVGNLSQGLYVLQLFDAKGQQVKTEKVIVAK